MTETADQFNKSPQEGNPMIDDAPEDIVPRAGLDRETILKLNTIALQHATYHVPGELLEDVDGLPLGVGPSTTEPVTIARPVITRTELENAGLTEEEIPNIRIRETH